MPAQWTGALIGGMHLMGISAKQLAAEAGWHEKYLSAVLNGHRNPRGAEQKLTAALIRLELKQDRAAHGLDTDLNKLIERYRAFGPEYAKALEELMNLSPASSE